MKIPAEMEIRKTPLEDPPKCRVSGGECGGLGLLWSPNPKNVPIDPSRPTSVPPPMKWRVFNTAPFYPVSIWRLATRLYEAGALKFFVIYFKSKKDLGSHARIFEIPEIAEMSYLCT